MSESVQSTVTVNGAASQFWGITPAVPTESDFLLRKSSTLNSIKGIFPDELPGLSPVEIPKFRYFGIGIRGYYNVVDSQQGSRAYYPAATNAQLHTAIPFRIVPVEEDLTPEVRALYRMRQRITHQGHDYFAYWLKVLELTDNGKVSTHRITWNSELENYESVLYVPSGAELNSQPSPNTALITTNLADTIVTSFAGVGKVTPDEVMEAINVLYDGDTTRARLSEFGVFSGVERELIGADHAGAPLTYEEAVYTHLAFHRCWLGIDISSIEPGAQLQIPATFQDGNLVLRT